jgi:hypothetical protein
MPELLSSSPASDSRETGAIRMPSTRLIIMDRMPGISRSAIQRELIHMKAGVMGENDTALQEAHKLFLLPLIVIVGI